MPCEHSFTLLSLPAALQYGAVGASGMCVGPAIASANQAAVLGIAGCNHKHAHPQPGIIQHKPSGLCLQPDSGTVADGTPLVYGTNCAHPTAAFTALANGAMVHLASGKCLAPQGGVASPADGTPFVLSAGCNHAIRFSYGPFPTNGGGERFVRGRRSSNTHLPICPSCPPTHSFLQCPHAPRSPPTAIACTALVKIHSGTKHV